MSISDKEYNLLNHLVRIWRAPFCGDNWKDKFYIEAENFIQEHYPEWLDYIHSADAFEELTRKDKHEN